MGGVVFLTLADHPMPPLKSGVNVLTTAQTSQMSASSMRTTLLSGHFTLSSSAQGIKLSSMMRTALTFKTSVSLLPHCLLVMSLIRDG